MFSQSGRGMGGTGNETFSVLIASFLVASINTMGIISIRGEREGKSQSKKQIAFLYI